MERKTSKSSIEEENTASDELYIHLDQIAQIEAGVHARCDASVTALIAALERFISAVESELPGELEVCSRWLFQKIPHPQNLSLPRG
jgi:hypothetical protein